jgi:TPR repeat protein
MAVIFENNMDEVAARHVVWLAALEDEWGLLELGCRYAAGKSMPNKPDIAVQYWHRAFSKNGSLSKYAAANIADLYLRCEYVAQPPNEAMNWLKIAAELGHPESQYNYGIALIDGIGIEKNLPKGIEWLNMAAKTGVTEAVAALQKLDSI